MEIKTFRAKTMPQAIALVRSELGPEATVLHTREHNAGLLARLFLGRHYEIAATAEYASASKFATDQAEGRGGMPEVRLTFAEDFAPAAEPRSFTIPDNGVTLELTPPSTYGAPPDLHPANRQSHARIPSATVDEFSTLLDRLRARSAPAHSTPAALFDLFTDLIEADVDESIARDLVEQLRQDPHLDANNPLAARAQIASLLEEQLRTTGPVVAAPGAGRVVALVGPTGVGKTTTIAKLAANFRLRENRRVGLITVDTYRIAAVEQLRTYADIIDLPMEVVSTPREMREAVQRMRTFDLVLMDTAGRSHRDDVKIQELRTMLAEAAPDEVHLVLSAAASARSLTATAEKFAPVGVTSLLVTKLDEATALGHLLTLARSSQLPFSYLTDGQNVPDDIAVAESKRLSQLILNINA